MTLSDETIPEVPGDPPYEGNPMTVDPKEASYEVLKAHLLDEALGSDPEPGEMGWVIWCMRKIYRSCRCREITLTQAEADACLDGDLEVYNFD